MEAALFGRARDVDRRHRQVGRVNRDPDFHDGTIVYSARRSWGTRMSLDPRVRELIDREAIRETLQRYCRGVDRRDLELL